MKKKTTLEANSKFGHGRDSVVTSITSLDSKCGEVSLLLGSEEEAEQGVGEVLKKISSRGLKGRGESHSVYLSTPIELVSY